MRQAVTQRSVKLDVILEDRHYWGENLIFSPFLVSTDYAQLQDGTSPDFFSALSD